MLIYEKALLKGVFPKTEPDADAVTKTPYAFNYIVQIVRYLYNNRAI
jgi:hypothetical protein